MPQKTPQEKTDEYLAQQQKTHQAFLDRFQREEEIINATEDSIQEAREKIFRKDNEDHKKFEKTLKKERNDFEDISSTGQTNVKLVVHRATKTLQLAKNHVNQLARQRVKFNQLQNEADEKKAAIAENTKKKDFSQRLCNEFLKKMGEWYLKHETMLDEENKARQKLAEEFNRRMQSLSEEL